MNNNNNCPKCGADREVLEDSLKGNDLNYELAFHIARNCSACSRALGHLFRGTAVETMTIDQFLKLDKLPDKGRVRLIY